ncbi:hypothetical protein H8R23_04970 [Flavobacterium sp. F-380]|uniref:Uncharacterized protein n=1 Tax=Flavobacterium kayseriense TaxID=2764714 RepID=A0ABR7J5C7_9FLAO|nr:hypothetical protein [Flavobacterium kayseriense]MBC5840749.1 hypothetical protein [Flavobacterium kayseriense]MBC5846581.1 hypothetical protein [Flavobacterium kayseriense]
MIQTKTAITYGDRSEKTGIIKVEVRPLETSTEGTRFLVIDWDISNPSTDPVHSKEVFWTNQEIDAMDSYLEQNNDFSSLSKSQKELKKIQLALYFDTVFNLLQSGRTIYRLTPDDWELTPDTVIEIPTE